MAFLFDLYSLSKSERAALPFVTGAFEEGIGQTAALNLYREAGGKIANGSWADLYKALEGTINASRAVQSTSQSDLIPLLSHGISLTKLSENFSYSVKTTGFDRKSGEEKTIFTTVTSAERLSPETIITIAENDIVGDADNYDIIISTQALTGGLVSFDYNQ